MNTTELQNPLVYSWDLIIIIIEILFIGILIYIFYKYFLEIIVNYLKAPKVLKIKEHFIKKLQKLLSKSSKMEDKKAYYELSILIRNFVYKTTGINVLTLSKDEIKKLDINELSLLMEEYYPPEFSNNIKGDITKSINKTIKVIEKWQ